MVRSWGVSCVFSGQDCGAFLRRLVDIPMICLNLHSNGPILLIGGGPVDASVLKTADAQCDKVLCVDSGLVHAHANEITPDLLSGDFDSLDPTLVHDVPTQPTPDQDFTDFEKALGLCTAPLVVAAGVLGGRLDHQLATFSTLVKASMPVVAVDRDVCVFAVPAGKEMSIPLPKLAPVALYPLLATTVTSRGVAWPLDQAPMAPDGLIGTSNHMVGDVFTVQADASGLLVIVPFKALAAVIAAFGISGR